MNIHLHNDDKTEQVLKCVDLDLPVNRMIAVVGESGAGKSTLIDTLTLLLRPQKGEIEIDGINSEKIDVQSWRRSEEHTSELQSRGHLVCRLLLEKKNKPAM